MGTGRDNFAKGTIREAAGRVGYRCSFPGCTNATIGASMENINKCSVTGVAAHICAAAKGGPRYDENMTAAERRNVENCIWLCETHARLIDTDIKTYSVDVLHQWKAQAEFAASKALANGDYFSEYYKSNGNNLVVLKQLFDDLVVEGQFDLMLVMLNQYKTKLSEQYEEFVLRYRIIYAVYCDRAQLGNYLDTYCSLSSPNGINTLVELFLSFHLTEELGKVIEFCEYEPLKKYAQMELSGELKNLIVAPLGSSKTVKFPADLNEVIQKYVANHIVRSKLIGATDVAGAKYEVFSDEFYYHAVSAAYELACATIYGKGNFEDILNGEEFLFIKNNIKKITLLDFSLQEYIFGKFFCFLSESPKQFEIYYQNCPLELKNAPEIIKSYYIYKINSDPNDIDCDKLLEYVLNSGEYPVLCMYLSCIDRVVAIEFLDEHGFLYKKNSIFLKFKLDLIVDIKPKDACAFLNKYRDTYKDDYTFHVLLAKYSTSIDSINEEIEWLNTNKFEARSHDAVDYIRILHKYQRWVDLAELSQCHLPNEYLFAIADSLAESGDDNFIKISYNLYQKLIDLGWCRKGLYFNFGVIRRQLGHFEEAKVLFQKEFDLYGDVASLVAFIQLRFSLNEYITDEYFEKLKRCIDAYPQNLIAAIYLKRCNYAEARKFFLRSLLLKSTDNPSIKGFFQTTSHLPNEEKNTICENTFCILKNDASILNIAIHDADVMESIVLPDSFAGYSHYSVQDARVSSLLFFTQGDKVMFDGKEFIVDEITSANEAVNRFFFSSLSTHEGVTVISSSSPEDFKNQISTILQKSSENLQRQIDEYNQLEIRSPLSLFAYVTGKGRLKTSEFLAFENREKIRNNLTKINDLNIEASVFVLSYESIVYLTHLDLDCTSLNGLNLACSSQVRNQLLNDINEELLEITDNNQRATMFYEEGELSIFERTSDMRRTRHAFLARLKSFVEKLQAISSFSVFSSCNDELKKYIDNMLSNQKMYCESSTISVVKNNNNAVLVTDDQFMFALANTEHLPNIGLTGLLVQSKLRWDELLSLSKKLKNMNYYNYFPIQLYKRIVDQMLDCEFDYEKASSEIQAWIVSDTGGKATYHHENIIISLYRDLVEQNYDYLNPDGFITEIVLGIWENRNPEFLKKCFGGPSEVSIDAQ